jgi:hypothetical protein
MAHYSFRRDLKDSEIGVKAASDYFAKKYNATIRELPKAEQGRGDFEVTPTKYTGMGNVEEQPSIFVEVKFDLMAAKTSNLCFEVSNGKKATGIMSTEADKVVYVVPQGEGFKLFIFGRADLLNYLANPVNVGKFRLVRGGDGHRFSMVIIPIETVEKDKVAEEVVCQTIITNAENVKQ